MFGKDLPLVSIIIPVRNGESFLPSAIATIRQQSQPPAEIIVIDDCSSDGTARVAKQYQDVAYVLRRERGIPASSRNIGIKKAKGDVIAFLDVDDLWPMDKLQSHLAVLQDRPDVDIVQGLIQPVRLVDGPPGRLPPKFEALSAAYQFVNLGSAIFRRSVFSKVGLFDESLTFNEDTDWFIRAWEHNVKKIVLDRISLFYCRHDSNMTRHQNSVHFGLPSVLKKHLERKRFPEQGAAGKGAWKGGEGGKGNRNQQQGLAEYIGGFPKRLANRN